MLFAVLASALLVAIGLSIFSISLKEEQIASSERDSQIAYYAADSAEECALYWDIKQGAFKTYIDSSHDLSTTTDNTIMCNGVSIPLGQMIIASTYPTYIYASSSFFLYATNTQIAPSADITVTKTFYPASGGSPDTIQTVVSAEGHNTMAVGRRVERGISETHNN